MKSKNLFLNKCNRIRSSLVILSACLLLAPLLFPLVSDAATLSGDSRTYLQSRENIADSRIYGLYEYLDFEIQNLGKETLSFHTGGWLRYDLGEEQHGRETNNDLQYSYLSYRAATGNTIVNLGRVMVFEGVASERVDGIYARTDLKAGFGISAFGGSPVETNSDLAGNDVVYGGRLAQAGERYRIGVSALKEEKNSEDYRKEQGIDLWVHPLNKVDLTGRSSYNSITRGWMEHSYNLSLGAFQKLRLNTEATWISYDDYFFRTTTSAFTLQNGIVTPGEKVRILGQAATYPFTEKLSVSADYRNFSYDLAGSADYYGGKVKYSFSDAAGAGFAYHRMEGETVRLQYDEYRAYAYRKIAKTDLVLDLIDVAYDAAINGVKDAYSVSIAALHHLSDAWKLGADAEYSKNPLFDKDVRAFIKVLYHFGAKGGV